MSGRRARAEPGSKRKIRPDDAPVQVGDCVEVLLVRPLGYGGRQWVNATVVQVCDAQAPYVTVDVSDRVVALTGHGIFNVRDQIRRPLIAADLEPPPPPLQSPLLPPSPLPLPPLPPPPLSPQEQEQPQAKRPKDAAAADASVRRLSYTATPQGPHLDVHIPVTVDPALAPLPVVDSAVTIICGWGDCMEVFATASARFVHQLTAHATGKELKKGAEQSDCDTRHGREFVIYCAGQRRGRPVGTRVKVALWCVSAVR